MEMFSSFFLVYASVDILLVFQGIPGSIGPPGIAGQRGEKV